MPVLSNARQERFAQAIASGKSAADAYVIAGYKPSPANACHLQQDHNVQQRITELLYQREQVHAQATAQAIEQVGLTKAWVIGRLVENVDRAMQAIEVTDAKGVGTGEYKYEGSVANRGLELLGKELGMFIDRSEDVSASRNIEQIDSRIREFFNAPEEGEAPGPVRGTGTDNEGNEIIPTVPGHGTS